MGAERVHEALDMGLEFRDFPIPGDRNGNTTNSYVCQNVGEDDDAFILCYTGNAAGAAFWLGAVSETEIQPLCWFGKTVNHGSDRIAEGISCAADDLEELIRNNAPGY